MKFPCNISVCRNAYVHALGAALLLGTLSMLFAEVFSGASRMWFLDVGALILAFPLYLGHALFFLWIALNTGRIKVEQLYLFGVLFGLYESWITKVLWAGYLDQNGPGFGYVFEMAVPETLILVFFWHPFLAFMVPLLVYEVFSGKSLASHEKVLVKTRKRTLLLALFCVLTGVFIANGNGLNPGYVMFSLGGTLVVVLMLSGFARIRDVLSFNYAKKWFVLLFVYLLVLYVLSFFIIRPDKIPKVLSPYLSVILLYALAGFLLYITPGTELKVTSLSTQHYSRLDVCIFCAMALCSALVFCFILRITVIPLLFFYLALCLIGPAVFLFVLYRIFAGRKTCVTRA